MWWKNTADILDSQALRADAIHRHLPDIDASFRAHQKDRQRLAGTQEERNPPTADYFLRRIAPPHAPESGTSSIHNPAHANWVTHQLLPKLQELGPEFQQQFSDFGNTYDEQSKQFSTRSNVNPLLQSSNAAIIGWNTPQFDEVSRNLAFQMAANDLFGLNAPIVADPDDAPYQHAQQYYHLYGKALRDYLLTQYQHTQHELTAMGVNEMPTYRGMHVTPDLTHYLPEHLARQHRQLATGEDIGMHKNVPIHLQPLSSHSLSSHLATNFIDVPDSPYLGLLHKIMVPREKIFSTPYTGFGVPQEAELVVLGGKDHVGDVQTIPMKDANKEWWGSDAISARHDMAASRWYEPEEDDDPYTSHVTSSTRHAQAQEHDEDDSTAPTLNPEEYMAQRASEPLGSNDGGWFIGTDGQRRYVKHYNDPAQANSEHIANLVYRGVGIAAPNSKVMPYKGKTMYVSDDMGGEHVGKRPNSAEASDLLKGFAADVLLANWDVIGLFGDNITRHPETNAVQRIDNGGALLTRGMGARKPDRALMDDSEWDTFSGRSEIESVYSDFFDAAGVDGPEHIAADIIAQIKRLEQFRQSVGGWSTFVKAHTVGLAPSDQAKMIAALEARSNKLNQRAESLHRFV